MWGFGSALHQDHIIDWRREFHKWWISEFKDVKLPTQDSIFDYQLDLRTNKFRRWTELAAERKIESIDTEMAIQVLTTNTRIQIQVVIEIWFHLAVFARAHS